eukprot:346705-Amphidinium_carterae.1
MAQLAWDFLLGFSSTSVLGPRLACTLLSNCTRRSGAGGGFRGSGSGRHHRRLIARVCSKPGSDLMLPVLCQSAFPALFREAANFSSVSLWRNAARCST